MIDGPPPGPDSLACPYICRTNWLSVPVNCFLPSLLSLSASSNKALPVSVKAARALTWWEAAVGSAPSAISHSNLEPFHMCSFLSVHTVVLSESTGSKWGNKSCAVEFKGALHWFYTWRPFCCMKKTVKDVGCFLVVELKLWPISVWKMQIPHFF